MKNRIITLVCLLCGGLVACGQGFLEFDNTFNAPSSPVTISSSAGSFNPADGQPGAFVGSDYTASLYYLIGTVNPAVFDGDNPILFAPADTAFWGTTGTGAGHGFFGDGSGFFEDDNVATLPTTGIVTVEVRAWYNGGGAYTSYDQALAAGQNVGESNPVSLELAIGDAFPSPLYGLLPFTVGVPEPSTPALFGLGALSLWLLRRRK